MSTKAYSWRRTRLYLSGVVSIGVDSSGRRIYMTRYMRRWVRSLERRLGWRPVIVQGAFMARNGGGAENSKGYHDGGGCLDFRTYNLSPERKAALVRVCRQGGAAAWLRTKANSGLDEHVHIVLGSDSRLTRGARAQWQAYLRGRDGLANNGPDYHDRPTPLVTRPPRSWVAKRKASK